MPAKINLALKVGGRRADGYHPLATVYHAVSLYDEVEASWAEADEFAVVDAAFAQRRKMLRSALSGLVGSSAAASEVLVAAGVDPQARGEALDIEAFTRIAAAARTVPA